MHSTNTIANIATSVKSELLRQICLVEIVKTKVLRQELSNQIY